MVVPWLLIGLIPIALLLLIQWVSSSSQNGLEIKVVIPYGFRGAIYLVDAGDPKSSGSGNGVQWRVDESGKVLGHRLLLSEWHSFSVKDTRGTGIQDEPAEERVVGFFSNPGKPGIRDFFVGTRSEASDAGFWP